MRHWTTGNLLNGSLGCHYFGSSGDMLLTDFSEHPVVGLVMVSDSDSENGWLWKHGPLVLNGLITNEEMMVHLEGSWLFPTLKTSQPPGVFQNTSRNSPQKGCNLKTSSHLVNGVSPYGDRCCPQRKDHHG